MFSLFRNYDSKEENLSNTIENRINLTDSKDLEIHSNYTKIQIKKSFFRTNGFFSARKPKITEKFGKDENKYFKIWKETCNNTIYPINNKNINTIGDLMKMEYSNNKDIFEFSFNEKLRMIIDFKSLFRLDSIIEKRFQSYIEMENYLQKESLSYLLISKKVLKNYCPLLYELDELIISKVLNFFC